MTSFSFPDLSQIIILVPHAPRLVLSLPKASPPGRGGGVLSIMAYTGRLRPKGVPFSGFRYIKRVRILLKLRFIKGHGNRPFRYLRGPLIKIFRIYAPYGCISLFF